MRISSTYTSIYIRTYTARRQGPGNQWAHYALYHTEHVFLSCLMHFDCVARTLVIENSSATIIKQYMYMMMRRWCVANHRICRDVNAVVG